MLDGMIIDSHHHFWKYNAQEYGWITDEMRVIGRDFLPEDLRQTIAQAGVDGVISVQARQKVEETQWLLELAGQHAFIKGVVGWVPLVSPRVQDDLERFADNEKLKGVRHVLQDEPDDGYMLREDFNRGIGTLREFGLRYDILIFERHLPQTLHLVDRHPGQVFILDHIGKPKIKANELSPWRENIRELARRQNVYCKISGMVTEADWKRWSEGQLRPYLDTVLEAFGPRRVMFGSDWPVCLVACEYERWFRIVSRYLAGLSQEERSRVMGGTAAEAYGLV